ncbi:hypothetical protein ABW19_dt0201415 [Dactylella cylindrospora]|nr:hypothetical protein ABW19_dt0201415 [Dactylella cylindrospora]
MSTGSTSTEQWCKFMRKCVSTRLDVDKFETYARSLISKAPLPRDDLASALISPDAYPTPQLSVDPRYLLYIQRLVSATIVPLSSFLHALLASDRQQQNVLHGATGDVAEALSRDPVDTAVLTALVLVAQGLQNTSGSREGLAALVDALTKWMDTVIAAGDGDGLGNALNEHGLEGLGFGGMGPQKKAVIGELVLAVGENQHLNGWLKSPEISKDKRASFENTLPMFVQGFQPLNPQLAIRLDSLIPKKADGSGGNGLLSMGIGLDAMGTDGGSASRGGLYVFINSLLFARPLVDDEYLIHYLINRYKELGVQAALDLITAAMDCIANAIARSESSSTVALFRHFLVNKIPLLLIRFNMPIIQAQFVLTQALSKSGTNPLSLDPTFSADSMLLDPSNDIKQEFLFACALHRIIEESSVEVILGDVPLQTMAKKRYTQDELVNECMVDTERLEILISEIEELDGNSGAIVGAVVEFFRLMCEQRDTMGLYSLCKNLISRPKTIDLLLLHSRPVAILEPLCIVLENWRYDDDQDEYEPVYKEFGYILLLVMTIYYRHNLNFSHLGNIPPTNFVPMFIKQCHKDVAIDDLSKMGDRHNQLGRWIKALFEAEGEGITNEVMQTSKPQEYFTLIPTLTAQTVEACDRGILDNDTLRGGLDCMSPVYPLLSTDIELHLTFVNSHQDLQLSSWIASEVAIIFWLTDYIWATQSDISNALRILHALVTNAPSEVTQTHKTILAICSHNLERVLKDLLRNDSSNQQAEQILKHLSPYRDFRRTGLPSASELDGWTKQSGGLLTALKNSVQGVIMWAATPDLSIQPASYTPRLLYASWRLLGAKEVLKTLVDELQSISIQNTVDGIGDIAIDVVANLICAPNPDDWRNKVSDLTGRKEGGGIGGQSGLVTLIEALRYLEDDMKLSMEDQGRNEVVVKLARKVESMLVAGAGVGAGMVAAAGSMVGDLTDGVLGDVMGDSDMFQGMQDHMDLGLPGDEIMGGM